jgi:DNA-binding NarL/FixJ family response regulator
VPADSLPAPGPRPGFEHELFAAAPLKVLLADDHPLVLVGLRRMLEEHDGIEVVGQASHASELVALAQRRRPDIVLTDLRMPGAGGVDFIAELREKCPEVKIVVLSASADRATVDGALLAGASAFIVKTAVPSDIASVLRQVYHGTVFHSPSTTDAPAGGQSPSPDPGSALTARELAILTAIASGRTTAVISKELWVSEHTVKFHLTNIYRKLGVVNRAGAIRYAHEHQLLA